jgi:excisionase family DNA binding protein
MPAGDEPGLLQAMLRALLAEVQATRQPSEQDDDRADLPPLLSPIQVGKLMGVSRNTVDRMVEDGELPSVVLREGSRQRMVRVPKAFVLQMLRDLNKGARITLKDYAARWSASVAEQVPVPGVPVHTAGVA